MYFFIFGNLNEEEYLIRYVIIKLKGYGNIIQVNIKFNVEMILCGDYGYI